MTNVENAGRGRVHLAIDRERGRKEAFYLAPDICCAASIVAKRA
jgi:hypothetical protein